MRPQIKPRPITAKEFEQFESEWRYDLIRGELHPMPPMPGDMYGSVTLDLAVKVSVYVEAHDLGRCWAAETRFVIAHDPDTAIGPDFAFIRKERLSEKRIDGFLPLVPDLVVEVRSPSDRRKKVEEKIGLWLDAGARLVWELNPKSQVLTVYRPGQEPRIVGIDGAIDGEDVLPGFSLPLRRLFPDAE